MYIERQMSGTLRCVMDEYPIVTVSGPRQSGKTTLVRKCLGGYGYVNLEDSDTAEFARSDPKGFLMRYPAPLVIDEVQRVPGLMSSLQVAVDSRRDAMGQYVLTGSHQSLLRENVAQSLAGRTATATARIGSAGRPSRSSIPRSPAARRMSCAAIRTAFPSTRGPGM